MANITISPAWNMVKTTRFNTIAQETAAQQANVYVSTMQTPVWDFKLSIPYLSGRIDDPTSTIALLLGLFVNAKGRAGTFTFFDDRDHAVTNYQFGTGDGSSEVFQLTRPIGGSFEWVQNVVGTPTIFINGTPTSAYTIDDKGIVTFNTAPANAAVLSWSGDFQFLLRMKDDSLQDLTMFFENAWTISTLAFESVVR
jgi:hypothetical protein